MIYRFGSCELDEAGFELRRDGERIAVQPKVLELLLLLVRRRGQLLTKAELMDALWPRVVVGESSLTRLVSLARRAVGDRAGADAMLETVAGRGYCLRVAVSEALGEGEVEHRLAAIMSADAVGYSRLMAQNEAATVESLKACRERVAVVVERHRGRVVDFRGDDFLAEFPSAVEATRAALAIQESLAQHNEPFPEERRLRFRIGLHLADVRAEGAQIFGDGINIAARLEGLAEPGGVCISDAVYGQLRGKLDLQYVDLGEQYVKNIPEPVHAFQIGGSDAAPPAAKSATRRSAIAVLPFDDLSQGGDQEYFADGLAEDLILRLSEFRWFPVVARNSSFVYKGRAVDAKEVGRALDTGYLVEGSVRRAGDVVRITAQLIDTQTGHHVWVSRYDRELRDVFAVQDEITGAIAGALEPELWDAESEYTARRPPQNLGAWDCIQRGWWHLMRGSPGDREQVHELCERAFELDPQLAGALYAVASSAGGDVLLRFTSDPPAEAAASADSPTVGPLTRATAHALAGRREAMIEELERAVQADPSRSVACRWFGLLLGGAVPRERVGPEAAGAKDAPTRLFAHAAALAHFAAARYSDALRWASPIGETPDWVLGCALCVASQAQLGRLDAARESLAEAERTCTELTFAGLDPLFAGADPAFLQRLHAGIAEAGWSE